jgi:uncharacterized protein YraI
MTVLLAVSSTVGAAQITAEDSTAATITSPDGILSIEMPGEEWKEKEDSDFWFEITDGHNSIAIDHLGNGEMLPDLKMAGEENEEICQAFISTKNEVFIVTGQADSREGLADVIRTVGTLRILKYDTRTAVQKETQTDQATQSNINAVNATYYVTADELNVRADCSADSEAIGTLHKGEAVTVTGSVTEDGADTGWYQIQYQGRNGFVSSSFLSQTASVETAASTDQTAPVETAAGTDQNGQSGQAESGNSSGKLQCEYCGQWFSPDELREHQLSHTMDDLYGDKIQCERCGEWLSPDALRDHQLGHTMEDMNAGN